LTGFIGLAKSPRGIKNFKSRFDGTQRFRHPLKRKILLGCGQKITIDIVAKIRMWVTLLKPFSQ